MINNHLAWIFLSQKFLNVRQFIYLFRNSDTELCDYAVLHRESLHLCRSLRSTVAACNSRRLDTVQDSSRPLKRLAIEKVCEFIALILSGNIYDWSSRPAGRESSLRFVRKLTRLQQSSRPALRPSLSFPPSPFLYQQRGTYAKPTVVFICTRTNCTWDVNPQKDIWPSWNLADNSVLTRWDPFCKNLRQR